MFHPQYQFGLHDLALDNERVEPDTIYTKWLTDKSSLTVSVLSTYMGQQARVSAQALMQHESTVFCAREGV